MTGSDIVAAVFMAFGLAVAMYCSWCVWLSIASRKWPSVTGTIAVSDLQTSSDSEGGKSYRAEISFVYQVDGEEFVGNHAVFGDRFTYRWSAPAVRLHRKYRPGIEVPVIYDPADPTCAVLERRVAGPIYFVLAISLLFVVFGYVALGSSAS